MIAVEKRAHEIMLEETELLASAYVTVKNQELMLSHEVAVAGMKEKTLRVESDCNRQMELSRNELRIHKEECLEEIRKEKAITQNHSIGRNCFIEIVSFTKNSKANKLPVRNFLFENFRSH